MVSYLHFFKILQNFLFNQHIHQLFHYLVYKCTHQFHYSYIHTHPSINLTLAHTYPPTNFILLHTHTHQFQYSYIYACPQIYSFTYTTVQKFHSYIDTLPHNTSSFFDQKTQEQICKTIKRHLPIFRLYSLTFLIWHSFMTPLNLQHIFARPSKTPSFMRH